MMEDNFNITVFDGLHSEGFKVPISPTSDKKFTFRTVSLKTPREMYQVMVNNFILNIPLNLQNPINTYRRIKNLKNYIPEDMSYIILDIDDVHNSQDMNKVLDYFRRYKCILGESKSHNGIDNFRLKGILFIEPISIRNARVLVSQIHHELKDYCNIDEAVTRRVSLNAPIGKMKILLESNKPRLEFNLSNARKIIDSHKESYVQDKAQIIDVNNVFDSSKNIETIEHLCLSTFESMGFQILEDNSENPNNEVLIFKHYSEKKTPGGYFWFWSSPYTMHHFNSTKSINIFESVRKMDIAKDLLKKEINYDKVLYSEFNDSNKLVVSEKYLKVTPEIQLKIEDFVSKKDGLFSIKSPMGTGKSTVIGHIIKECHEEDMRVLIITNRISVAQDFSRKYSLKLYNRDQYNVGDSVVVQYDSLWKYNIKNFDIVIMDEFISLMLHSRSNLSNSSVNIAKFFAAFNKKLVIADAFLTGYEKFLINHKKTNIHVLDNQYRDNTKLLNYEDFNHFIQKIIKKADSLNIDKHEKITISSTSLSVINELELLLTKRGLRTVTLTAETSENTKELVYGLFEDDHDKFDVLLYSPTLTVGISNMNNVKDHFHYDSSMSSDVISSLQMIKRSRKAKRIHLLIRPRIQYIRTSYNEIRDDYMDNIGQNIGQNYLFEIDNYGEPRLSRVGVKAIKIDTFSNILEFNHKDAFFYLCKYHFDSAPKQITTKFQENALSSYKETLKESQRQLSKNRITEFMLLNDIEKYDILVGKRSSDRILKSLVEVETSIVPECSSETKKLILERSLSDLNFIRKCRLYKIAKRFLDGESLEIDISHHIHKAIIDRSDDLKFFSTLLELEEPLKDSYNPKESNQKKLKYVLEQCGYRQARSNEAMIVGERPFFIERTIKDCSQYIN